MQFLFIQDISILLTVVWYLQRRKHLLVEKEEELEALRRLLHETEGDESGNNDKFVKKMLLQQLGLIRIVATNPSSDHQELLVQMGRIANKDVAVDDLLVWSDLYKTIDMVHDGFYTRISQKYGNTRRQSATTKYREPPLRQRRSVLFVFPVADSYSAVGVTVVPFLFGLSPAGHG